MAGARGANRVYRDVRIAIGAILKAHRAGERRSHLAVDLALRGASPDGPPTDEIGDKLPGHHIQKLGRGRHAQLVDLQKQFTRQLDTVVHTVAAVQIRIGDQTFPAHDGARLFKIGAHHDFKAILVLIAQHFQALSILHRRIEIVNGAGTNNHQ
ncbi:hypothetical protein D3C72_1047950 [compost metagenome]